MKNDNIIIASKLLSDFSNFLDKRSPTFVTWPGNMLDGILQWHYYIWKKEHECLEQDLDQDDKLEEWSIYDDLLRTMDSIIHQIQICFLKGRSSHGYFRKFKKHVEKYEKFNVKSHFYVQSLFDAFYQVFFENIYEAPDRFDIWNHYFPGEWKITKSNLQNTENVISRISRDKFINWARDRIWRESKEIDLALNDVSGNLFPEVNPIIWAKILIFILLPNDEDRVRSAIEKPWNFGFIGRVRVYSGTEREEIEELYKDEEAKTFELAYVIFKEEFSERNLLQFIQSLERLSYPKESVEDSKRFKLYNLFTRMLDFRRRSDNR